MRIVSLLPSATEIICSLGLENELVGVTHECDHPAGVRSKPKVTHTLIPTDASSADIDRLVRDRLEGGSALYTLNLDMLEELKPDLIVTQALCDVCAVSESEVKDAACRLPGSPRVLNLEPETLNEVLDCVREVGMAAGLEARSREVVAELRERVDAVTARAGSASNRPPRVALLEWLDPPFSAGHWNPELVRLAGGVEGLGQEGQKSRTLDWNEVLAWRPEVVVISCCGFTAARAMEDAEVLDRVKGWERVPAVVDGRVHVTDGTAYFSRPGPRLVDSLELLAHVIDPARNPRPDRIMPPIQLPSAAHAFPERR